MALVPNRGGMPPLNGGQIELFGDAHSFLQSVSAEVEALKRQVALNDEARREEVEGLRKQLEQERFERRDALNKLRYEFEEFVHQKIDKVLEEVEEMKRTEQTDDSQQQFQIDQLIQNVDRLKENLFSVQTAWSTLVSNCLQNTTEMSPRLGTAGGPCR
uniref:Uncharacterized protein n=1 Tax=Noctiluca scintillans TaxID=2966 RepID=A0A7S0ZNR3_NOCSC